MCNGLVWWNGVVCWFLFFCVGDKSIDGCTSGRWQKWVEDDRGRKMQWPTIDGRAAMASSCGRRWVVKGGGGQQYKYWHLHDGRRWWKRAVDQWSVQRRNNQPSMEERQRQAAAGDTTSSSLPTPNFVYRGSHYCPPPPPPLYRYTNPALLWRFTLAWWYSLTVISNILVWGTCLITIDVGFTRSDLIFEKMDNHVFSCIFL